MSARACRSFGKRMKSGRDPMARLLYDGGNKHVGKTPARPSGARTRTTRSSRVFPNQASGEHIGGDFNPFKPSSGLAEKKSCSPKSIFQEYGRLHDNPLNKTRLIRLCCRVVAIADLLQPGFYPDLSHPSGFPVCHPLSSCFNARGIK